MYEFNIAICDDDIDDLNSEKELINSIIHHALPNTEWTIDTFLSPKDMLQAEKIYNIVLLDVEMPGMSGIEAADFIHRKNKSTLIFFVTNHEDYMDDALNKHAFRFWTKPINKERLIRGIKSAEQEINSNKKIINVISEKKSIQIPLKDIIYIYHNGRYSYIVTITGDIKTYAAFKDITEQLPRNCFVETHGSYYVNLNYVTNYDKDHIICEYDGKIYKPYLSRRKYKDFYNRFVEWSSELR